MTFLDTADVYGPFTNERLLGRALAGRRDEVVLATKFGNEVDADGKRTGRVNGRPAYLRAAVEGSLQRLGVDVIDLHHQHRVDRGFLGGTIRSVDDFADDDFRRTSPRFQGDDVARNLDVLDRVVAIAEVRGVTPSQLALAWVLAQGDDVVPIPGTRRVAHLQDNAAAVDITPSAADLAALDEVAPVGVAPVGVAAGERYAPAGMRSLHH